MRFLFELDGRDYDDAMPRFVRPSVRGIIIRNGKVALVHSLKYDYYNFPGGGIEGDEDHIRTLIREVGEETGLRVLTETVRPYGMARRIQRRNQGDVFVQENYFYLCDAAEEMDAQHLVDYEAAEDFTLEFVEPRHAIAVNSQQKHGAIIEDGTYQLMIRREVLILEKLMAEGCL